MATEGRQCEAWTKPRHVRGWWTGERHRCPHTARFRVVGNKRRSDERDMVPLSGEYVCGRHVRPALMDNGDSVWEPWVITPIEAESAEA